MLGAWFPTPEAVSLPERIPHFFCYVYRLALNNSYTRMAFIIKTVFAGFIFGEIGGWFPLFAFRASLKSRIYFFKIFILAYSNLRTPSFTGTYCRAHQSPPFMEILYQWNQ
jgi:hypothetical protein